VILNLHMNHWTWQCRTRPCWAKPKPALPNVICRWKRE